MRKTKQMKYNHITRGRVLGKNYQEHGGKSRNYFGNIVRCIKMLSLRSNVCSFSFRVRLVRRAGERRGGNIFNSTCFGSIFRRGGERMRANFITVPKLFLD